MALIVKNLKREFGSNVLFNSFNFEFTPGEIYAITGHNGVGKTTLLKMLSTIINPSSGSISYKGECIIKNPKAIRNSLGLAPAVDSTFIPRMSGAENLEFFSSLQLLSKSRCKKLLENWCSIASLNKTLQTPYYLCSSGMKQILSLCRSMLHDPAVLILDEPTRSMDKETRDIFYQLVLSFKAPDKIIVIATHLDEDIDKLGARELKLG